ncbi:hypothetical protein ABT115_23950 [Streptomyces sp. NPDC001832]|uniref:hypothetical protein n=1 Tax=Streptomyces sp. NPDC001832 TaxID=3154527 RepID=UPI0033271C6A
MRNDPVLNAVRQLRPQDAEGWAQSPQGQHILDSVLSRAQVPVGRRRPSRTMVVGGALLAMAAGGGAMAAAGGLPWSEPGRTAMCARTLSPDADLAEVSTTKDFDPRNPGASCARQWTQMWGPSEPVPTSFTACFHPGADVTDPDGGYHRDPHASGGPVVYPADGLSPDQACARIGAKPIPVSP